MSEAEFNLNIPPIDIKSEESHEGQDVQSQIQGQASPHDSSLDNQSQNQNANQQPNSRVSQRNLIKAKESAPAGNESRTFTSVAQSSRGAGIGGSKGMKLELTEAEKELLRFGDFSSKTTSAVAVASQANAKPGNRHLNCFNAYFRGNESILDGSQRQSRFKTNYHDDFVYGDLALRKQINQKDQNKDNSNSASGGVAQSGNSESGKTTQKGEVANAATTKSKKSQAAKKAKQAKDLSNQPQVILSSNPSLQLPIYYNQASQVTQQAPGEHVKLYCVCRTADETADMIGCDKCDEWFHFVCVGIDPTSVPDMDSYEFVCPECVKKSTKPQGKKSQGSQNMTQVQSQSTTANKRNQKAHAKQQPKQTLNQESENQIKIATARNTIQLQNQQSTNSSQAQNQGKRKGQKVEKSQASQHDDGLTSQKSQTMSTISILNQLPQQSKMHQANLNANQQSTLGQQQVKRVSGSGSKKTLQQAKSINHPNGGAPHQEGRGKIIVSTNLSDGIKQQSMRHQKNHRFSEQQDDFIDNESQMHEREEDDLIQEEGSDDQIQEQSHQQQPIYKQSRGMRQQNLHQNQNRGNAMTGDFTRAKRQQFYEDQRYDEDSQEQSQSNLHNNDRNGNNTQSIRGQSRPIHSGANTRLENPLLEQQKRINENNLEKVVQQDDYLYFVTKDARDQPIESHFKMPVPDRRLQIKDDSIANLRNILLRSQRNENNAEEKKDQSLDGLAASTNDLILQKDTVNSLIEILKRKFQHNLINIPLAYSHPVLAPPPQHNNMIMGNLNLMSGNGNNNNEIMRHQQQQVPLPEALFHQE
eukprot:403372739